MEKLTILSMTFSITKLRNFFLISKFYFKQKNIDYLNFSTKSNNSSNIPEAPSLCKSRPS